MRFIRKNGRIIPIHDSGNSAPKPKAPGAGERAATVGTLAGGYAALMGADMKASGKKLARQSHEVGQAAVQQARAAIGFKLVKNDQAAYRAARDTARGFAKASLQLGAAANRAAKFGAPLLVGGVAAAAISTVIGMHLAHRRGGSFFEVRAGKKKRNG